MLRRVGDTTIIILLVIDIMVQVVIRSPIYIITGKHQPDARETISAWVGGMASNGWFIGVLLSNVIDSVLGKGHCAEAYKRDILIDQIDERTGA